MLTCDESSLAWAGIWYGDSAKYAIEPMREYEKARIATSYYITFYTSLMSYRDTRRGKYGREADHILECQKSESSCLFQMLIGVAFTME